MFAKNVGNAAQTISSPSDASVGRSAMTVQQAFSDSETSCRDAALCSSIKGHGESPQHLAFCYTNRRSPICSPWFRWPQNVRPAARLDPKAENQRTLFTSPLEKSSWQGDYQYCSVSSLLENRSLKP